MTYSAVHPGFTRSDELVSKDRVARAMLQPYGLSKNGAQSPRQVGMGFESCHPSQHAGTGKLLSYLVT